MSLADFVPFLPEIFLAVAAFTVLLAGIPLGRRGSRPVIVVAIGALAATAVLIFLVGRPAAGPQLILGDMLVIDQFAVFFKLLVLAASALALLMAAGYLDRAGYSGGEFAALVLCADLGMFIMASGANLASLYVGLELMALSVYVLVGFLKRDKRSNEAALGSWILVSKYPWSSMGKNPVGSFVNCHPVNAVRPKKSSIIMAVRRTSDLTTVV